MRKLLRCRRGSVALATVIALVPLIGVVALGAEAGSWYVTKQQAQNAADSAAVAGALRLACSLGATTCTDTNTAPTCTDTNTCVVYRGKEFAAQNAFCNAGDTSYPGARCPSGITQTVHIEPNGNQVLATVSQTQPAYLAAVLGFSTITIPAHATAQVTNPKQLCGLGLGNYVSSGSPTSSLIFAGSATLSGQGCGFQSDNTVKFASAPSVSGTGWAVYAASGCINSGFCNNPGMPYNYSMAAPTNPLGILNTESFNTASFSTASMNPCTGFSGRNANVGNGQLCNIASNTLTTAYTGNLSVSTGGTAQTAGGTYFFNGGNLTVSSGGTLTLQTGTYFFKDSAIKLSGTVTGTAVNIVLLGNSSLSITGGNVQLSANFNNTTYPDLNGVLIDDQATNQPSNAVTISGGAGVTIALGGAMYFPNVDVTMSGNSQNTNTNCTEVIANSLTIGGGTNYFSTNGCAPNTIEKTQVVVLVQDW